MNTEANTVQLLYFNESGSLERQETIHLENFAMMNEGFKEMLLISKMKSLIPHIAWAIESKEKTKYAALSYAEKEKRSEYARVRWAKEKEKARLDRRENFSLSSGVH